MRAHSPAQVIGGPLRPGAVLAFAHETPHVAEAHDCTGAADGCLRLILSFAGDNGVYVRGRHAGPAALFLACVIGFGAAFRQT